jgi:anthranilate/para-aminobenzoate synthase component I
LHTRLIEAAPTPFGAAVRFGDGVAALSTSPELFLDAAVRPHDSARRFARLETIPIKGTRARGVDAASDEALARALHQDPKERAELTMIIDVERNDLGSVAEVGSVRVLGAPRVTALRTVHHRDAHVVARARASVSREEVIAAMFPSGSVTGAPKVRAMEVIASLEPFRRGLYTGAIGYVANDGSMRLAMAIRTVVLRGAEGEYLTGGGIVADSDPVRELEETRWKAEQLARIAAGRRR